MSHLDGSLDLGNELWAWCGGGDVGMLLVTDDPIYVFIRRNGDARVRLMTFYEQKKCRTEIKGYIRSETASTRASAACR